MSIYRVVDWEHTYENNRSRELKRMEWVPVPNKMDGLGYTTLMQHPDGVSHLGAWLSIIEIASRCETRGTLVRGGVVLTIDMMSVMSRVPASVYEAAIPRFLDIKWLELVEEIPQDGAGSPQEGATLTRARRTERNGIERNGKNPTPTPPERAAVAPDDATTRPPQNGGGGMPKQPLPGELHLRLAQPPHTDELWARWRAAAGKVLTREIWTDHDWDQAYDEGWRRLDPQKRLDAVDKTERNELSESCRKASPVNVLRKTLFYRRDGPAEDGPPNFKAKRKLATMEDLKDL